MQIIQGSSNLGQWVPRGLERRLSGSEAEPCYETPAGLLPYGNALEASGGQGGDYGPECWVTGRNITHSLEHITALYLGGVGVVWLCTGVEWEEWEEWEGCLWAGEMGSRS